MIKYVIAFVIFTLIMMLSLESYPYRLSIATVTKEEHEYLKEWIEYHLLVGVDHFYIYDNNDQEDFLTYNVLEPFIKRGVVDYTRWPNKWPHLRFFDGCQLYAYQYALAKAKKESEWLAIMDTDEFIVPMKGKSVIDVLDRYYRSQSNIYVNWRIFGTSNKWLEPGQSMLHELTRCSPTTLPFNKFGKTICRPSRTNTVANVHFVDSNYPVIDGSGKLRTEESYETDLLRINHYFTRDERFLWDVKYPRHMDMWQFDAETARKKLHSANQKYCLEEDRVILKVIGIDTN